MTIFNGGPANGKVLDLKRSPLYLRVTHDPRAQKFDALDQLEDEPREGETVFAYLRVHDGGMVHLHRRNGCGGWFSCATYQFLESQPTATILRDSAQWREWCRSIAAKKP